MKNSIRVQLRHFWGSRRFTIYISVDELDKEAVNKIKARLGEDAYYKILYGSTIASDLVCLAGLVSELNAVPGSLNDLPSERPGTAPEMGGESGRYSLPQGISQEQFSNASKLLRDRVGDISNDIVVQGS